MMPDAAASEASAKRRKASSRPSFPARFRQRYVLPLAARIAMARKVKTPACRY